MSKLHLIFLLCVLLGLANAKAQYQPAAHAHNSTALASKNLLAEYVSTGEMNLQWNSDKEVLIIASPHQLRSMPNKKAYSHCTKFGAGASFEDGFIVYKGKKNAIVVSGLELGEQYYFTSYEANDKGVFNVPGPSLTSFVVWSLGSRAEINFKASTLSPDQHFIIERSADGIHWTELTTLKASQELNGPAEYNYVDKGPLSGDYMYRLQHSTIGSNYIASEPVSITSFSMANVFEAFPAEEDPNTYFVISDVNMELTITNTLGLPVKTITLDEKNNFGYTIDDLPNGIYNISGTNYNGKLNSKITVNR
jgi:hypothetical protein